MNTAPYSSTSSNLWNQVEGLAATPTFYIFDNEDEKAKQLSGMKLLTFFHDQAQQRGLSGYGMFR